MVGVFDVVIEKGCVFLQVMFDLVKFYIVKGGIGGGSNFKMCYQVFVVNQIFLFSEVMGFVSYFGFDLLEIVKVIIVFEGWSWMFEYWVLCMLDFNFQFLVSVVIIIMKDISIIILEVC